MDPRENGGPSTGTIHRPPAAGHDTSTGGTMPVATPAPTLHRFDATDDYWTCRTCRRVVPMGEECPDEGHRTYARRLSLELERRTPIR